MNMRKLFERMIQEKVEISFAMFAFLKLLSKMSFLDDVESHRILKLLTENYQPDETTEEPQLSFARADTVSNTQIEINSKRKNPNEKSFTAL